MITNEYINRAIDYILDHINENIPVDEIASYCNFSRYYFSRMFKMETGESIHEFIKRVKMEQSAFRLKVEKGRSITDISCDYGYSSSNYSSAFKQHHNLSPIEFRRSIKQKSLVNPIFRNASIGLESFDECDKKISIEVLDDCLVIYERHKGNYGDLSEHWGAFQVKYKEYITEATLLIERTYDDPSITHIDECLYDLCLTAPQDCALENIYTLIGGKFAVYHFKGTVDQIYTAYQSLFNVWLPQSKYEMDDRYGFEIYRKIDCNTMYMEIDLCIPIQ
ncbi:MULTISPECIES: AraC family transcriptional regulator [unclassified Sedimentibacter]|uniref:AraC family transcriptional regulator n=1 Tax=unclassified Sedimentibacter TaxID=2649220 RepID=UPI0027E159EE|nr:GyrI-like domain-containing protein [Sedimentibacter sp. MB35-C1]WMJ77114.1 GyrI-like domain-containing protein [Sedimentibacter sp. MB35-C1]